MSRNKLLQMNKQDLDYLVRNSPDNLVTYLQREIAEIKQDFVSVQTLLGGKVEHEKIVNFIKECL